MDLYSARAEIEFKKAMEKYYTRALKKSVNCGEIKKGWFITEAGNHIYVDGNGDAHYGDEAYYKSQSVEKDVDNYYHCGIMKEWDESLHPRDENGKFTDSGGSVEVDGPAETQTFIDNYMNSHPEVLAQAEQYNDILSTVKNFTADEDGTYDALTGEMKEVTKGYCVTFHQNKTATDVFGGYTDAQYAAMCAIAMHELDADGVNIGYFGNPEVSFTCDSPEKAMQFAIAHNQHSIFDAASGKIETNDYYNPATNPIKGHE